MSSEQGSPGGGPGCSHGHEHRHRRPHRDRLDREGRSLELAYDRLVMAAGSSLVRPQVPGAEHLFDVDTMPAAARLHSHINRLDAFDGHPGQFTAVVVGGGFTGLEVATELPSRLKRVAGDRPVRVILVDRAEELAAPLGEGPRPTIATALERRGVEVWREERTGDRFGLGRECERLG